MSQGGVYYGEKTYETPMEAAAAASINFTGPVVFHGRYFFSLEETYGTLVVAAAAASANIGLNFTGEFFTGEKISL